MNQVLLFHENWAHSRSRWTSELSGTMPGHSVTHGWSLLNSWWNLSWLRYTWKRTVWILLTIPAGGTDFCMWEGEFSASYQHLRPYTEGRASIIGPCNPVLRMDEGEHFSWVFLPILSWEFWVCCPSSCCLCKTGKLYPKHKRPCAGPSLSQMCYLSHTKREK